MKLVAVHIVKQEKIWRLEACYEGFEGNIKASRVYNWDMLSSTEALAKVAELFEREQN